MRGVAVHLRCLLGGPMILFLGPHPGSNRRFGQLVYRLGSRPMESKYKANFKRNLAEVVRRSAKERVTTA